MNMQSNLFNNIKDSTYLHIPKTGGTALLNLDSSGFKIFNVNPSHSVTLFISKTKVIYCVRDPWERFCSGFWEIKTLDLRHKLFIEKYPDLQEQSNKEYIRFQKSQPLWSKDLLTKCNTPNDLCSLLKADSDIVTKLYSFNSGPNFKNHVPLGLVTQSISWWLGDLEDYKKMETKVAAAIDIKSLNYFMRTMFNVDMPDDPFLMRSRSQFDIEQSYNFSTDNIDWFVNSFRKKDYELIDYIKQQPYYFVNEKQES